MHKNFQGCGMMNEVHHETLGLGRHSAQKYALVNSQSGFAP